MESARENRERKTLRSSRGTIWISSPLLCLLPRACVSSVHVEEKICGVQGQARTFVASASNNKTVASRLVSLLKSVTLPWFVRPLPLGLPLSLSRFCPSFWPCTATVRAASSSPLPAYRAINKSPSRANPANPLTDAPLSRAYLSFLRLLHDPPRSPGRASGDELPASLARSKDPRLSDVRYDVRDSPRYRGSLDMLLNPR